MTENLPNSTDNQHELATTVATEAMETETMETETVATRSAPMDDLAPWQNFGIGFSTGALLSFVAFSISIDMTHTALADVGLGMWVGAIALPLSLGILSILFKQPFINALDTVMRVLPY
ncbi:MAG: hypothetical protein AB8B99_02610 [Phormidesmis sp.]